MVSACAYYRYIRMIVQLVLRPCPLVSLHPQIKQSLCFELGFVGLALDEVATRFFYRIFSYYRYIRMTVQLVLRSCRLVSLDPQIKQSLCFELGFVGLALDEVATCFFYRIFSFL